MTNQFSIYSDLIKLAAELARGEGVADWSDHKFYRTTPMGERRDMMNALRNADEAMRQFAIRLKTIADRLSAEMRKGHETKLPQLRESADAVETTLKIDITSDTDAKVAAARKAIVDWVLDLPATHDVMVTAYDAESGLKASAPAGVVVRSGCTCDPTQYGGQCMCPPSQVTVEYVPTSGQNGTAQARNHD